MQKCEISELKRIKALILTSRDSKIFHEQFHVEMPEPPEFLINPGHNFSIGYPIQGGVEILDDPGGKEEIDENIAFENTPVMSSNSEVNDFIRKPCIRHMPNRHVTFDDKVHFYDTSGKVVPGKLAQNDKSTACCPNFLPVCKIYNL